MCWEEIEGRSLDPHLSPLPQGEEVFCNAADNARRTNKIEFAIGQLRLA